MQIHIAGSHEVSYLDGLCSASRLLWAPTERVSPLTLSLYETFHGKSRSSPLALHAASFLWIWLWVSAPSENTGQIAKELPPHMGHKVFAGQSTPISGTVSKSSS